MKFKELREASGMRQSDFARYFNIPLRTIQHWEAGTRKCPEYLLELMEYKLYVVTKGEMDIKVKNARMQIKHIEKEISNLKRLYDLDEDFMYDIEAKAKLDSSIGIMVDVSIDVMNSWIKVLQEHIDKGEV